MFQIAIIIFAVLLFIFGVVVFVDVLLAKKNNTKYHTKQVITAFLFILPAAIFAFFFIALPILYSLGYAFTDTGLFEPDGGKFIGFENFKAAFEEIKNGGTLAIAIKNTAIFVVLVVPLQITVALLLALFCNVKYKGRTIFKVCFFAPVVISLAVTSYLWLILLDPSSEGLMNTILMSFGLPQQEFLRNPDTTMIWIVIVSAWQGAGYQMLIFSSALSGIRKDLYEAARMDGCNAWKRFWKVTLPGLKPTLLYILITVFIGACRIMVQPMLMVGSYDPKAITISYFMYGQAYDFPYLVGYSSAIALLMTIFTGTITFLQRKLLGEKRK